ncbi:hypothetical protein [Clostridium cibarium]|uniref:DUF4355 domain-containing protein n=1 Tax=Clostridium cibarium TaxID=2762247 RepID=A0ABR8PTR1_9CLOT|nr:hypothetical protein [Clostridium cibarium]MBD7911500.1 hypothetical protein [Clostridium cibarium]
MKIDSSNVRLSFTGNDGNTKSKSKTDDKNKSSLKVDSEAIKQKRNENRLKFISDLEKMKEEYKKKKEEIEHANLTAEQKKARLKDINGKIKDVQTQIDQIKAQMKQEKIDEQKEKLEKKKAEEEKNSPNNKKGDVTKDGVVISRSLYDLINLSASERQIHSLRQIKAQEKIESNYLGNNPSEKSFTHKRAEQITASAARIDANINSKISEMAKVAKKHVDDDSEVSSSKEGSDENKAVTGKYAEKANEKELQKMNGNESAE